MDGSSNSLFDGFGDNFLDDLITHDANQNGNNLNNYNAGDDGGSLDILQQSLQAADIINEDQCGDFASIDDFNFGLSNDQNETSSNNLCDTSSLANSNASVKSSEVFDASQFLNFPEGHTGKIINSHNGASEGIYITTTTPQTPLTVSWTNSPKSHANSINSMLPTKSLNSHSAAPNYLVNQTSGGNSFKIQLSSNVHNVQQSGVYVITSHQMQHNSSVYTTLSQSSASSMGQTYLVSNDAAKLYSPPLQAVSSNSTQIRPSIMQVSSLNQVNQPVYSMQQYPINSVSTIHLTPVQTSSLSSPTVLQTSTALVQGTQSAVSVSNTTTGMSPVDKHQANKLAILLQKRASQTSGGTAILRVGNQNINISNPDVANALAASILRQQKAKQQQLLPQTESSQSTQPHFNSPNPDRTFVNIACDQQNSAQPVIRIEQSKPQYILSPVLQQTNAEVNPNNTTTQPTRLQPVAQSVIKSSNHVPINRIQIASVNIPISTPHNIQINVTAYPKNSISSSTQSITTTANMQALPIAVTTATTISSALIKQLATNLKLKLTAQQASQLTKEQLQRLLIQHQAAVRARKVDTPVNAVKEIGVATSRILSSSPINTIQTTSSIDNIQIKPTIQLASSNSTMTTGYMTYRVEPNLTFQQVEQIQHIISHKLPVAKSPPLSKEQKQLLAAFRAQLKSMDTPVQQYYLRNPQLFLQKVYQHLQTGKDFVLHIKVDVSNAIKAVTPGIQQNHPTINLNTDQTKPKLSTIKINRTMSPTPQLSVRQAIKRPAQDDETSHLDPPSLIMEKLRKHQDLCITPDNTTNFKGIDDAIERLLPYHVCNMPEIAQKDFDRSEPLFSSHSTYLVKKVDRMLAKYNILSLREDARTCCSADLVMLERSFLQHERAQLAKLKQEVNENPTVLKHYIPPTSENQEVLSFLRGECEPSGDELDNSRLRSESEDSQICSNSYVYNSNYVKTFSEKPSALYEPVECEVVSFDHQQDSLLQEAVDSILY